MACDIKVSAKFNMVYVHINGVMHLSFVRSRYLGIQSWRMSETNQFFIEITLDGGVIVSDYDSVEKWTSILSGLEDVIYWGKAKGSET